MERTKKNKKEGGLMPIEITGRYMRIRVRSPAVFKKGSFRTHDIGRLGHSKRIAGIRKKTGKWQTQAFLINKNDIKKRDPKTMMLLGRIGSLYNMRQEISRAIRRI